MTSILRQTVARHVVGDGIELGPGHNPFPLPSSAATVRYLDRWEPDANRALFAELGDDAAFPKPDLVVNLDLERLDVIANESVDFVIASHILEHMANPLAMLDEIHRVLRVGGVAIILMPDRHETFDAEREPTSLAHVLEEYHADTRTISDDQVVEFLRNVAGISDPSPDEIALHLERSFHVHCWNEPEFRELMQHAIAELGQRWHLVDGLATADPEGNGIEFGYVVRKLPTPVDHALLSTRFGQDWETLRLGKELIAEQNRLAHSQRDEHVSRELARLTDLVDSLLFERDQACREIAELRASTSWKASAPLRGLSALAQRLRR